MLMTSLPAALPLLLLSSSVWPALVDSSAALRRYNIPEQCRLDLTETDIKFAKSLLEKVNAAALRKWRVCKRSEIGSLDRPAFLQDYVKRRKEWVDELNIMLRLKKKAEIQARAAATVALSLPSSHQPPPPTPTPLIVTGVVVVWFSVRVPPFVPSLYSLSKDERSCHPFAEVLCNDAGIFQTIFCPES